MLACILLVAVGVNAAFYIHTPVVPNDVFLQGDFLTAGVDARGYLGTTRDGNSCPVNYFCDGSLPADVSGVSIFYSGSGGFQSGVTTLADFFDPGYAVERWSVGSGGVTRFDQWQGPEKSFLPFVAPSDVTFSISDVSFGNFLGARTSQRSASACLDITQDMGYFQDGLIFMINVTLQNTCATQLTNVRYMRHADCDQDSLGQGIYKTYNKIEANPPAQAYAAVSCMGVAGDFARLEVSDLRGQAYYGPEVRPQPYDSLWDVVQSADEFAYNDDQISLLMRVGNLNPGQSESFQYRYVFGTGTVPSGSMTRSVSRTPQSRTPTATVSLSISDTSSITPSISDSSSASPTRSDSSTRTPTPSPTSSITPSRSESSSGTPTSSTTATQTPTSSTTASVSETSSGTSSITASGSITPSHSVSSSVTPTVSVSPVIVAAAADTPISAAVLGGAIGGGIGGLLCCLGLLLLWCWLRKRKKRKDEEDDEEKQSLKGEPSKTSAKESSNKSAASASAPSEEDAAPDPKFALMGQAGSRKPLMSSVRKVDNSSSEHRSNMGLDSNTWTSASSTSSGTKKKRKKDRKAAKRAKESEQEMEQMASSNPSPLESAATAASAASAPSAASASEAVASEAASVAEDNPPLMDIDAPAAKKAPKRSARFMSVKRTAHNSSGKTTTTATATAGTADKTRVIVTKKIIRNGKTTNATTTDGDGDTTMRQTTRHQTGTALMNVPVWGLDQFGNNWIIPMAVEAPADQVVTTVSKRKKMDLDTLTPPPRFDTLPPRTPVVAMLLPEISDDMDYDEGGDGFFGSGYDATTSRTTSIVSTTRTGTQDNTFTSDAFASKRGGSKAAKAAKSGKSAKATASKASTSGKKASTAAKKSTSGKKSTTAAKKSTTGKNSTTNATASAATDEGDTARSS